MAHGDYVPPACRHWRSMTDEEWQVNKPIIARHVNPLFKRIADLEAQVTRLQEALREQDKWWWESVGESQAAHSDGQLTEQWGLQPGDLDLVNGEGDGDQAKSP